MSNDTQKISLSFSKTLAKKQLQTSALKSDDVQIYQENKQSILLFDKHTKQCEPAKPEDNLVIPLVESKRDNVFKDVKRNRNDTVSVENEIKKEKADMTLDEQAAAAIIEESKQKMENLENKSNETSITLNLINISSENKSTNIAGSISTLEEYDQINVEHFGAALLRGMGWKKSQGIGKAKRVVDIIDPTNKNLALTTKEKNPRETEELEEEDLKKGCHVLIESGRNRGIYGIVESVDEDHILVRTARDDKVLRDVEQNVRVVSTKEYKDFSRVINKNMYDDFKAAESRKKKEKQKEFYHRPAEDSKEIHREEHKREERVNLQNDKLNKAEISKNKEKVKNENYESSEHLQETTKRKSDVHDRETQLHKRKEYVDDKYNLNKEDRKKSSKVTRYEKEKLSKPVNPKPNSSVLPVIPWARENLRVRIIDKKYKGGKYHKEKVIVHSIDTVESCTCISEEGKMLYDINPNHLETVIPKSSSAIIMIINGSNKGQKARILELHKEKEKATVQLLEDGSIILKLYYDDICEYISR